MNLLSQLPIINSPKSPLDAVYFSSYRVIVECFRDRIPQSDTAFQITEMRLSREYSSMNPRTYRCNDRLLETNSLLVCVFNASSHDLRMIYLASLARVNSNVAIPQRQGAP